MTAFDFGKYLNTNGSESDLISSITEQARSSFTRLNFDDPKWCVREPQYEWDAENLDSAKKRFREIISRDPGYFNAQIVICGLNDDGEYEIADADPLYMTPGFWEACDHR